MGKWELIKDFLYIIFIGFLTLIVRAVVYLKQKYFIGLDTYAYLNPTNSYDEFMHLIRHLGVVNMVFLLCIISILTSILFYFTCRQKANRTYSFMASILFSISPLVFMNNQFGLVDKNIPSLFMIILGIYFILRYDGWKRIILLIPYFIIFSYVWEGWFGFLVLIAIYYFFKGILDKTNWIIITGILIGIITLILGYGKFRALTNPTDWNLISELNPIWNVGIFADYLFIAIIWVLVFTKIRLDKEYPEKIKNNLFLYIGFIFTFIFTIFIFRMNIFMLPFLYIWVAIFFEEFEYNEGIKIIVFAILLGFILLAGNNVYKTEPYMNDNLKEALNYVDTLPTKCLIGIWDKGHIYDYYTNKTIPYRATAGSFQSQVDYMVFGNQTNCSIIYDQRDLKALNYMLIYLGKNISIEDYWIIKNNQTTKVFGNDTKIYWVYDVGAQ